MKSFRELDDLVLHLKGLVLVRDLLEQRGASPGELREHGEAIDRLRDELAHIIRTALSLCIAAKPLTQRAISSAGERRRSLNQSGDMLRSSSKR